MINDTSNHGFINNAGNEGFYWSSVVNNANNAYNFYFNTTTNFNPSNNNTRYFGMTILLCARIPILNHFMLKYNHGLVYGPRALTICPEVKLQLSDALHLWDCGILLQS